MAAFKIRKAESTPIGIELPLEKGAEIVEVTARRIKAKDAAALEEQIRALDAQHTARKISTVDYLIAKTRYNVDFSAETEAKLRELDMVELTQFAVMCSRIALGEHDQEKKPE